MSLKNLVGRSLEAVAPDRAVIGRLLAAAECKLTDARLAGLSAENRFNAAYKAIMRCAMAALRANGYRTLTSRPGHHRRALQTLPLTVGNTSARVRLSHQRHLRRAREVPLQLRFPRQILLRPFDFAEPQLRRRVQGPGRVRQLGPCNGAQVRAPRGDDAVDVVRLEDVAHGNGG